MDEVREECNRVVDEICEIFGYDSQDKEDNDSLKTVLKKAVFVMCKDATEENRNLLFQMLRHTPIIITDDIDKEKYEELEKKYIGNPNPHVINAEDTALGEYGKQIGEGAYVSEPVLDDNLNVVGKKSFIYVSNVFGKVKKIFGTDINVSHLIHELGHAWHAEKEQFTISEDGMLQERVGTIRIFYSFTKTPDGKIVKNQEKAYDLLTEEGINTVDEENFMADYLGITLDEMQDIYSSTLVPNNYQGYIAEFIRYMMQELGREEFEKWRMNGDLNSKAKIEALMQKTDYWKTRQQDMETEGHTPDYYKKKKEIIEISGNKSGKIKSFFEEYQDIYFPETKQMTPLEEINNALTQYYNMKVSMICYNMGIDDYSQLLKCISNETYPIVNEASLIKLKETLKSVVGTVGMHELNDIACRIQEKEDLINRINKGERE